MVIASAPWRGEGGRQQLVKCPQLPPGSGCYGDGSGTPQWDCFRSEPRPDPAPDVQDWSDALRSRVVIVAMVIAAANRAGPGCAEPESSAAVAKLSGRMRASLPPLGPPVSRDRIISSFPKWYTPAACLQLKEHFHGQVNAACQRRNTGTVGLSLSKAVVVGDLHVGKTSLIHRFCKNVFDHDYKATIGVDFEIERFEIAGIPYSLQIWDTAGQEKFKCIASAYYRGAQVIITAFDLTDVQTLEHTRRVWAQKPTWKGSPVGAPEPGPSGRQWLEDALRENEPGSCFIFLVGTKKDLLGEVGREAQWEAAATSRRLLEGPLPQSRAACEQAEGEAVHLANQLQAEYWSVSAKTGENVTAFFSRVAALAFEQSVLQALERRSGCRLLVGDGDLIRMEGSPSETQGSERPSGLGCC
ncbi:Ras-related protein Rab-36 [Myotis davidii]|uniref:Ras-related protein Rab-36 n=1 Tax=Myotis davidii TaxID=225400 RepID=L5LJ89_MYODS|nr:Ras-related protein Rab-36 [Myotis davidii]